jgi:hypothetical protein
MGGRSARPRVISHPTIDLLASAGLMGHDYERRASDAAHADGSPSSQGVV